MANGVSEFNETEHFEEFNTHPYKGGYDIVLNYGTPLPPSPAICYPISGASSYSPICLQVPPPSVPADPPVLPEASGRATANSVGREDDLPGAARGSPYGNDERGLTTVDWWGHLPGFSQFMIAADGNILGSCGYDAEELRFSGQLRRAADYIFGYSQGFGERRIGVDSLGIPIYAYKRHGNDIIHADIGPARTEKVDYYCDSLHQETLPYSRGNVNFGFSSLLNTYEKHHSEELPHTEVDPFETVFSWKTTESGLHEGKVPLTYGKSRGEVDSYGYLGMDFNTHHHGVSQNFQMEANESSYQTLSYPEASYELDYTDSDWESSYNGHENENNVFTNTYHEEWEYKQPSHLELEPYRSSWAQCPEFYGTSEEINSFSQPISDYSKVYHESSSPRSTWQTSSLGECVFEGKFCSSVYPFTLRDEHYFELEPYRPTWMLNPNYYGTYEEISAPHMQI